MKNVKIMTRDEATAEKDRKIRKARSIADDAENAGRDLTPGEMSLVSELIAEAKACDGRAKHLEARERDMAELNILGAPGGIVDAPFGSPGGAKALGAGGRWAKSMTDFLGAVGAKTLTPNGQITVPTLDPGVVASTDRPRSVLQLIPSLRLEGTDQFSFLQETVRQHNVSTVAPGKVKPTSVYSIEKIDGKAVTIAHLSEPMKRQDLADNDLLRQYLEGALRDGVYLGLEDQVLNGNGSTAGVLDDMTGIRNTSGIQVQAFNTSVLKTTRKAVTALEVTNIDLRGVAWTMHPSEWEALELLTSSEMFVMSGPGAGSGNGPLPVDAAKRTLWGFPVVASTAIEVGAALLGDFGGSARLRPREEIEITWSEAVPDSNGDVGYVKNTLTFRGEGRWGLEVSRPRGFVEVELVAGSGS